MLSLLGALCTLCSHPRSSGIPHIAKEKSDKSGGKGMPPLGLPPPLGARGGHPHNLSKK